MSVKIINYKYNLKLMALFNKLNKLLVYVAST